MDAEARKGDGQVATSQLVLVNTRDVQEEARVNIILTPGSTVMSMLKAKGNETTAQRLASRLLTTVPNI